MHALLPLSFVPNVFYFLWKYVIQKHSESEGLQSILTYHKLDLTWKATLSPPALLHPSGHHKSWAVIQIKHAQLFAGLGLTQIIMTPDQSWLKTAVVE